MLSKNDLFFFTLLLTAPAQVSLAQTKAKIQCQDFLTKDQSANLQEFIWIKSFLTNLQNSQIKMLQNDPIASEVIFQLEVHKTRVASDLKNFSSFTQSLQLLVDTLQLKQEFRENLSTSSESVKKILSHFNRFSKELSGSSTPKREVLERTLRQVPDIKALYQDAKNEYQASIAQAFSKFMLSKTNLKEQLGTKAFHAYKKDFNKQASSLLDSPALSFALRALFKKLTLMNRNGQLLESVEIQKRVRAITNTLFLVKKISIPSQKAHENLILKDFIETIKHLSADSITFKDSFFKQQKRLIQIFNSNYFEFAYKNHIDPLEQKAFLFLDPTSSPSSSSKLMDLLSFLEKPQESKKELTDNKEAASSKLNGAFPKNSPISFQSLKKISKSLDLPFLSLLELNPEKLDEIYKAPPKLGLHFSHDGFLLKKSLLSIEFSGKDLAQILSTKISEAADIVNMESFSPELMEKLSHASGQAEIYAMLQKPMLLSKNFTPFQGDYTYPKLRIKEVLKEKNTNITGLAAKLKVKGKSAKTLSSQISENSEKISIDVIKATAQLLKIPITELIALKPISQNEKVIESKSEDLGWIHLEFLNQNPALAYNLVSSPFSFKILSSISKSFQSNPFLKNLEAQIFKSFLLKLNEFNELESVQTKEALNPNEALNEAKLLFEDFPRRLSVTYQNFIDTYNPTQHYFSKIRNSLSQAQERQSFEISILMSNLLFNEKSFQGEMNLKQINTYQDHILNELINVSQTAYLNKPFNLFFVKLKQILNNKAQTSKSKDFRIRTRAVLNTLFLSYEILSSQERSIFLDLKSPLIETIENLDSSAKKFKNSFFQLQAALQKFSPDLYAKLFQKNYIDPPKLKAKLFLDENLESKGLGLHFPHDGITLKAAINLSGLSSLEISNKLQMKNSQEIYDLFLQEKISPQKASHLNSALGVKSLSFPLQK